MTDVWERKGKGHTNKETGQQGRIWGGARHGRVKEGTKLIRLERELTACSRGGS